MTWCGESEVRRRAAGGVVSETIPADSCSGVGWRAGFGKAQVATSHDCARATARPVLADSAAASLTLHSLTLPAASPYTLFVICSRPPLRPNLNSTLLYLYTSC
jgi:hypothetical protein